MIQKLQQEAAAQLKDWCDKEIAELPLTRLPEMGGTPGYNVTGKNCVGLLLRFGVSK